MRCCSTVVLILVQRLRRCPNIKTTLGQRLVSAGKSGDLKNIAIYFRGTRKAETTVLIITVDSMLVLCWASVADRGPTSTKHCIHYVEKIIQRQSETAKLRRATKGHKVTHRVTRSPKGSPGHT